MKRQLDPGLRGMLLFSGWLLLAASAALILFGLTPLKLVLFLLALGLLIVFYRL